MTDSVRMDGKCLTRNKFYANLNISLPSYHIFDMTPVAIHMKSEATAFVCVLIAILPAKIIKSILASGIRNLKVRLDFFPFIVIIIQYFYAEKENSHFYNKEVNPHFFK